MANFAQLDENNIVINLMFVDDDNCRTVGGIELEEIGIFVCKKQFGSDTNWKQTSYNGKIRSRYAQIGYTYNEELDAFIPPKPFPSWVLNKDTADWESPLGPIPLLSDELSSADPDNRPIQRWDEDLYQSDNTKGWTLIYP